MRHAVLLILLVVAPSFLFVAMPTAWSEPPAPIELWPQGVPGEADSEPLKEEKEVRDDGTVILSGVSVPTLTVYPVLSEASTGAAVLVCPGGGYNVLANSHEGTEVCAWLNSIGINAGLLKYRVPRRADLEKHVAPLQDVQRALTILRSHADEWKLDVNRVGILGFSAGGHLSAMALTSDGNRTYPADAVKDEDTKVSAIPDFGMLVYPAYLTDKDDPVELPPEVKVTETTPATFLVVAHDDSKYVEGSARFYIQMLRNKRPCELHVFAKGGHGFGMRKSSNRVANWPQVAAGWLKAQGVTK